MFIPKEKSNPTMNSNGSDGSRVRDSFEGSSRNRELLFFDTFSHEAAEELNLDLVQFPNPVMVEEVRVIPLGARVTANFPGGVRLGATNPTDFQLEFFVNDLGKPGAATFESLGGLHYNQGHRIHFQTSKLIPTDGLVLRGMYNAITLAVYGTLSKSTAEQLASANRQSDSVNHPHHHEESVHWNRNTRQDPAVVNGRTSLDLKRSRPCSRERSGSPMTEDKRGRTRSPANLQRPASGTPSENPSIASRESPKPFSNEQKIKNDELFEEMSDISEGDIPDVMDVDDLDGGKEQHDEKEVDVGGKDTHDLNRVEEDMEEISEDEAQWSDAEEEFQQMVIEFGEDWEDPIKIIDFEDGANFPPFPRMNVTVDQHLRSQIVALAAATTVNSEWLEQLEDLTKTAGTIPHTDVEVSQHLWCLALKAIDIELALSQTVATDKVRHIKSGLKYLQRLHHSLSSDTFCKLIESGLQWYLIRIIDDKAMAHSIKAIAVQVLDCSLNSKLGFETLLGRRAVSCMNLTEKDHKSYPDLYTTLVELLVESSSRLKQNLSALISKLNFFEACCKFETLCLTTEDEVSSADKIDEILDFITENLSQANKSLSQNHKLLPVRFTFQPTSSLHFDPFPGLFSILSECHILQSVFALSSNPDISPLVLQNCCQLLECLSSEELGIQYLCENCEWTKKIVKLLLDTRTEDELSDIALKLFMNCHALSNAEGLKNLTAVEPASQDVFDTLQTLYSLTFNSYGRSSLVTVLSFEKYAKVLIQLLRIEVETEESVDDASLLKTGIKGFALELLLLVVRYSESSAVARAVASDFEHIEKDLESSKSEEIQSWIAPFKNEPSVDKMCDIVKKYTDSFSPGAFELISAARFILMSCDSSIKDAEYLERQRLEYLITIHNNNLMDMYVTILNNICNLHEQPSLHTATFSGTNGMMLLLLTKPMIKTLRLMLNFIITSRVGDFKDTRCLRAVLRTYHMNLAVPKSSLCYRLSVDIRQNIVELLNDFAKPTFTQGNPEPSPENLWTLMLDEIVSYTQSVPHAFVPGLRILSELLPAALPICSKQSLSSERVTSVINARKLWGAHIINVHSKMRSLIRTVSGMMDSTHCSLLRQVCVQIADISLPTAQLVCEELMKLLADSVSTSVDVARNLIGFIAWMCESPAIKVIFTSAMEDQESSFCAAVNNILKLEGEDVGHEQVMAIFQALCDPEISMSKNNTKEQLRRTLCDAILSAIFDYVTNLENLGVNAMISCYRTLRLICDQSLTWIAKYFKSNAKFFDKILKSMQNLDPVIFLNVLGAFMDFFEVFTDNAINAEVTLSSNCSKSVLAALKSNGKNLGEITEQLKNISGEEDQNYKDDLLSNWEKFIERVDRSGNENFEAEEEEAASEESLSVALPQLFDQRDIVRDDSLEDIRKSADRSNTPPPEFLFKCQNELKIDLLEISESCFGKDYSLEHEIGKVCDEKSLQRDQEEKAKSDSQSSKSILERRMLQNKNIITSFRAGGTISIRGRGFNRLGQRPDGFRSRPPNTSRPPSLHVDDFLLLQERGQQPTGPTGYNKQSIKAAKELFAQREAEQIKGSIVGFREATKMPVYSMERPSGRRGRGDRVSRERGPPTWNSMHSGSDTGDRRKWLNDRRGVIIKDRRKGGSLRDDRSRYSRNMMR